MVADLPFFLAVGALGWGLALAFYRPAARDRRWPSGTAQRHLPAFTTILALLCIAVGGGFALSRGIAGGGVVIALFGAALAVFWLGFLRVGAQSALLLAPGAAIILLATRLIAA
ncbi:hypothetical protein [Hyphomicrobium sp. D-2]|uniref:hypothetical protein n=1 Tax=Hyphomicrobium sp. D-2 TaxID=3041621 RepID=UPI0024572DE0|nr:hypothetical protein [Hyphomicrobium sp. D-2]MDH4981367.1 hypothetical protein [Hyphomicrobium sp. D-2]